MNNSRRLRLDLARYYRLPAVQASLSVVLAFLISAFFIMFAIRPTFATIVKLQKNIRDSRIVVGELETKVRALGDASRLLDKIKPKISLFNSSIPSEGLGYDELSRNIESLAQNTNVTVDSFIIGRAPLLSKLVKIYEPDKKQVVADSSITIRISGVYPNLITYLTKLASSIRLTSIDSITIIRDGKTSKNSGEATLTMTIVGNAYFMVDAGAIEKLYPGEKE